MLEQDINTYLAKLLNLKSSQIDSAIKLLDDGNTIPFIARYRKEATGEMKDEQLRDLSDKLTYIRNLIKRQYSTIYPKCFQLLPTDVCDLNVFLLP